MAISKSNVDEAAVLQRRKALSSWDNEGGSHPDEAEAVLHKLTEIEIIHLRIRVIAMENLVISLLAEGSNRQFEVAKEMATYILPRDGFTQHPLTIKAASQMSSMVDRAVHFRTVQSS